MTRFEFVQLMMESIGAQAGFLQVDYYEEDQFWLIVVSEDAIVIVDIDDDTRQLVLSATVCTLNDTVAAAICRAALTFNHVRHLTGGLSFSIDEETNELSLSKALTFEGLSLDEVTDSIAALAAMTKTWREMNDSGNVSNASDMQFSADHMLRV